MNYDGYIHLVFFKKRSFVAKGPLLWLTGNVFHQEKRMTIAERMRTSKRIELCAARLDNRERGRAHPPVVGYILRSL